MTLLFDFGITSLVCVSLRVNTMWLKIQQLELKLNLSLRLQFTHQGTNLRLHSLTK
jgi:hypothetical protein